MDRFLGEDAVFWIRVRAAMQKAKIETPEELEIRLGVTPPVYEIRKGVTFWEVVERRPVFGQERVIGYGPDKDAAERIRTAIAKAA